MGRRAHASHILLRQKSDAVRLLSEIQEARKPLKTFQKMAKNTVSVQADNVEET